MKQIAILLLAVLTFSSVKAQKITEKFLSIPEIIFPSKPIPTTYKSYAIQIYGSGADILDHAVKTMDIDNLTYNAASDLLFTFTIYNTKFTGSQTPKGSSVEIKAGVVATLGYSLRDGAKTYAYGMINLMEKVTKSEGGFEEVSRDFKEVKTIPQTELSSYMSLNPETERYDLTMSYKNQLLEEESKLLLMKISKILGSMHNKRQTVAYSKYLSLKKHSEEDNFSANLKQFIKEVQDDHSFNVSNFKSVAFWKEKAGNSTDAMVQGVALFNLTNTFTSSGDMQMAKKYYAALTKVTYKMPEKQMEKLSKKFKKKYSDYLKMYDENGVYVFNEPMKVEKEGYVVFSTGKGMEFVSVDEYEEMLALLKKIEAYDKLRLISGVKGAIVTKENEKIEGEISITLGHSVSDMADVTLNQSTPSQRVFLRAPNEKGKIRSTGFPCKKVNYFTAGSRKFYSFDIKKITSRSFDIVEGTMSKNTNESISFFEEEKVFKTGILVRLLSNYDMDYAIKLNHKEEAIVFHFVNDKNANKRLTTMFGECTGMSEEVNQFSGDFSKAYLTSLMEAHDLNCSK